MAWTTISFAFASKLTSLKMTQMQSNFTALADGVAGSPKVASAAIGVMASLAGQITILPLTSTLIPAGLYYMDDNPLGGVSSQLTLEMQIPTGWVEIFGGLLWSDGVNFRVTSADPLFSQTMNYRLLN